MSQKEHDYRYRKKLGTRAILLFMVAASTLALWEAWWLRDKSLVYPVLGSIASVTIVAFSKYRKHLILLTLGVFFVMGTIKIVVDPRVRGIGTVFVLITLVLLLAIRAFFPDKESMDWLYEEPGLGEDGKLIDLKLSAPDDHQSSPSEPGSSGQPD
jgi:hypothetical protein